MEKNLQVDVSSPRLQSPRIPRSGAEAHAALGHSLQPAEQLGGSAFFPALAHRGSLLGSTALLREEMILQIVWLFTAREGLVPSLAFCFLSGSRSQIHLFKSN